MLTARELRKRAEQNHVIVDSMLRKDAEHGDHRAEHADRNALCRKAGKHQGKRIGMASPEIVSRRLVKQDDPVGDAPHEQRNGRGCACILGSNAFSTLAQTRQGYSQHFIRPLASACVCVCVCQTRACTSLVRAHGTGSCMCWRCKPTTRRTNTVSSGVQVRTA